MQELLQDLAPAFASGQAALVRLGKFCSAESKTVAWRSVRNSQAKAQVLNSSTLWMAELDGGRLPLGWALLELGEQPSDSIRAFCDRMGWNAATEAPAEEDLPAPPSRIVPDKSTPARKWLCMLEDGYDQGKANDRLLETTIKESKAWPEDDRLLLARLVQAKARANNWLPAFKWRDLDKLLLPLPE
jgi:hypothetical protein